ncbi:transcription/translation regulatory transformer protein RfaH [Paraferrimonas haliotis]|nr:transcription/translation regulatory transformer protein RfaH [Paraferrimonas haliotis]
MNWYLVYSKPKSEQRAKENLEAQQLEVYLPTLTRKKRLKSVTKSVTETLFPGYLFVRFDPEQFSVRTIKNTRGVASVVQFGSCLQQVPEQAIQAIKCKLLDQPQQFVSTAETFNSGDNVEVTEGPFAHLNAIYDIESGEQRCFVLLEMMGNQHRIELAQDHIRKA